MTSCLTDLLRRILWVFLVALALGCSGPGSGRLTDTRQATPWLGGFKDSHDRWETQGNRYWSAQPDGHEVVVLNSPLGAGVSPVWLSGELPRDFELLVRARVDKEGLDGGWGIEFGGQDRKFGYRALIYASGRFCVDRLFGLYPEFVHCVPTLPEVSRGDAANVLGVRVSGTTIVVSVNDKQVLSFKDPRYRPGEMALAVGGSGTMVTFEDIAVFPEK
jgi:hypothetical protein